MGYLLDTNILTPILKKNQKINTKLEEVRFLGEDVFISCITYFESKRGLLHANATRQISELDEFCRIYRVLFLDDLETIEKACEIHAYLKRKGRKIQEADVLIAATAIVRGLVLVSDDSDLLRVEGLNLENWLRE
ncbi:putative nucleic acid-binding protein, contains PIN domain [Cylindrospermum stagnale PCC 7417]|uniref:Putative nucleic acid-binding protein, contains PIN domain n=1 Tax=Cylindrospermum stagnale PCC 7417 TaxID=56107 RepID=K9WW77_9NOST|nr:type II toxin-antitoxin system VapC family toxin [Cylindrospermum stagnale]AFZ24054.1 putative nucleic acid-binding protein, contains PIN domain [Cylindrospermum stagnale PCC 7417]